MDNSWGRIHDGRVRKVNLKASLTLKSHIINVEAHKGVGFALDPLTKEAQAVTSRNDSLDLLERAEAEKT
ncbi:hypothetical protein Tco_1347973 [Tanacetum coccineum]